MRKGLLPFLVVLCVTAFIAGCNIVTPVYYAVAGSPNVLPEYTLEDKPTVVFVDDLYNIVNPISLRKMIGDGVSQELMSRQLVMETISTQSAINVARQYSTNQELVPIAAVGEAIGAKQIIYVEVLNFADRYDGFSPRPGGSCRVRVIDVDKKMRVYPAGEDSVLGESGRTLSVTGPIMSQELYTSRTSVLKVREVLAERMAREIARLFYEYEPGSGEFGDDLDSSVR